MTIQELYDWGKENNCLRITLAKNSNLEIQDIEGVVQISSVISISEEEDRIILD